MDFSKQQVFCYLPQIISKLLALCICQLCHDSFSVCCYFMESGGLYCILVSWQLWQLLGITSILAVFRNMEVRPLISIQFPLEDLKCFFLRNVRHFLIQFSASFWFGVNFGIFSMLQNFHEILTKDIFLFSQKKPPKARRRAAVPSAHTCWGAGE